MRKPRLKGSLFRAARCIPGSETGRPSPHLALGTPVPPALTKGRLKDELTLCLNPSPLDLFQLKCDSPVSPDEGLLVLNFTGASLCVSTHARAPAHPYSPSQATNSPKGADF